ncbi:MAG: O-antigen ligase family protein [Gemmatimonadota bacterium]
MTAPFLALLSLLAITATLAAVRWRRALFMALPFLVAMNGVPIRAGGLSIRLDQVAASLLSIALACELLSGKRTLRLDATTWYLAAILAVNVVASALHSPAFGYSLAQCANLASAWITYPIVIMYLDSPEELELFFTRCMWAGFAATTAGVAAFVLGVAGVPVGGAEVSTRAAESFAVPYGAFGTMVEPNIFGSYAGAYLLLATAMFMVKSADETPRRERLLYALACSSALALVVSFTRSAWLAVVVAALIVLVPSARRLGFRAHRLIAPAIALVVCLIVLLLLPGDAGAFFRFKAMNLVNIASPTAATRVVIFALALQQSAAHPIIGWGTFTFAAIVAEGADFARYEGWRNLWVGNYLLLALHDTGVIGLGLWIGMLSSIVAPGFRAVRRLSETNPVLARRALALLASIASLLVAYLSTSAFTLAFFWLIAGVLAAHGRLANRLASPAPAVTDSE